MDTSRRQLGRAPRPSAWTSASGFAALVAVVGVALAIGLAARSSVVWAGMVPVFLLVARVVVAWAARQLRLTATDSAVVRGLDAQPASSAQHPPADG